MHIDVLPLEILEDIFLRLDGQSLTRAESVCTKWRCYIQTLQKKAGFWKKRCQAEISECVLEELLGYSSYKLFLEGQEDQSVSNNKLSVNWKSLYKSWFRGKMIACWPQWKKHIKGFETNPVTCIKLSGAWVVTGHRNGSVQAWNRFTGDRHEVAHHLKMVTDFALMDIFRIGPYLPLYSDEHTWNHHLIVSVAKDHVIQVNPTIDDSGEGILTIHFHSNSLETVRAFNSCFAVGCIDNTISIWKVKYECKYDPTSLSASVIHSVVGPAEILQWIGFWNAKVQSLSAKGIFGVYCTVERKWVFPVPSNPQKRIFGIKKAFLFRNTVIVIITGDSKLWISVDGKHYTSYYTMKCIRTSVVSVALWGRVLVLGTENGRVLLYHVPRTEDLMTLNLENPSWSSTLSEASVIAVDVSDSGQSPVIVASTTESIFVITWFPPVPSPEENRQHHFVNM